jgi:hypothetical protein
MGVYDGGGKMGKNSTQTGAGGANGTGGASTGGKGSAGGTSGGGAGTKALSQSFGSVKFGGQKTKTGESAGAAAAKSTHERLNTERTGGHGLEDDSAPLIGGTTVRRNYVPGAVPNIPDPSAGQVISSLAMAPTGPLGVLGAIAGVATSDEYGRTLLGQAIDENTGGLPGLRDGWQPDRDRNLDGGPSGDGVMLDQPDIPTGDGESDPGGAGTKALYSDVLLQDRRKPRNDSIPAGTRMALSL